MATPDFLEVQSVTANEIIDTYDFNRLEIQQDQRALIVNYFLWSLNFVLRFSILSSLIPVADLITIISESFHKDS